MADVPLLSNYKRSFVGRRLWHTATGCRFPVKLVEAIVQVRWKTLSHTRTFIVPRIFFAIDISIPLAENLADFSYSPHFYFHFDYHDTVIFIDLELSKTFIYRKPHNTDNIIVYAAGHLGCTWHSWCPVLPAATWLVWCTGSWADLPGLHCAHPADCCGPQGEFNFIVSIWLIH